jgi:hypothetical protein
MQARPIARSSSDLGPNFCSVLLQDRQSCVIVAYTCCDGWLYDVDYDGYQTLRRTVRERKTLLRVKVAVFNHIGEFGATLGSFQPWRGSRNDATH